MTPEEKLNHLKEWMYDWIDFKILSLEYYSNMVYFYNETGMLLYTSPRNYEPLPFEKYIQLIENQK
jgi:hypothetical protein